MFKHFKFLHFFVFLSCFFSISAFSVDFLDDDIEIINDHRNPQEDSLKVIPNNQDPFRGSFEMEMNEVPDNSSLKSSTHSTITHSAIKSMRDLKDAPSQSTFLKFLECYTNCCAGYHVGCQSFWSATNGPLGFGSLSASATSTILSVIAAAAVSSGDPTLIYNLSIASTVLGTASAILGAFKMYAQSRSSTEQEKAVRAIETKYQAHCQQLLEQRNNVEASLVEDPENAELKADLKKWDKLVENAQKNLESIRQNAEIVRGAQANIVESEGNQQSVMLNANQMNAMNAGTTTTDQPSFEELPSAYKCCQNCLGRYDMGAFTCYHVLEGPAGLGNMLFSSAGAALMAFSIFNTDDIQANLIYAAAASNAASTVFSAFKFYAGARVSSSLRRLKKLYQGDEAYNKEQHELDLKADAEKNSIRRQSTFLNTNFDVQGG